MALRDQPTLRVLLYEGAGAYPLATEERFTAMTALLERGYAVTRTGGENAVAPRDGKPVLVLGRFTGAAPAFADAPDVPAPRAQEIAGLSAAQIGDVVEGFRTENQAAQQGAWKPWFPVIDYDRCTNCMQCLSFCLFGVYGVDDEKRIQVQNNDNCKTNCPACSRVCPEAAIMFPKYKAGPINGDVVSDADLNREKMKIDISALLGGDVYDLLRQRSEKAKSRFGKERDADKALAERQRCLVKLASANAATDLLSDIPPEVLMSLPGPEEIRKRAEEAAIRGKVALDGRD